MSTGNMHRKSREVLPYLPRDRGWKKHLPSECDQFLVEREVNS